MKLLKRKKRKVAPVRAFLGPLALLALSLSCEQVDDHSGGGPDPEPETELAHPFPDHTSYVGQHIRPAYSQTDLDRHTTEFYDNWKGAYLKACGDMYYIDVSRDIADAITVSEAHGYGMMLMCYMAGHEADAKTYFDGMYAFYKAHPSNGNDRLMDWKQTSCSESGSSDDTSASDGDIDIAFALLLADKQ